MKETETTAEIIILKEFKKMIKKEPTEREMIDDFIKNNPDKYHVYDTVPYEYDSLTKPTPRRRSKKSK